MMKKNVFVGIGIAVAVVAAIREAGVHIITRRLTTAGLRRASRGTV